MVRFLIRAAIFLVSAALGLLVAAWLLPTFQLSWGGALVSIVLFAILQSVLSPFIAKLAARNAPAFLGGIGLVSTFLALLVATLFTGGLNISGWQTWVLATIVVWLVTALCSFFLPMIFLREKVKRVRGSRGTPLV
ncbi:phage holin family protein [Leifsonia poae]|uniref:phage holin family protein n=1 Tax=Leifsonia poae TaxID=110933 RepID=UPI001CBF8A9F|nr:phage holin family protein [Leifsonia poae]